MFSLFANKTPNIPEKLPKTIRDIIYDYAFEVENYNQITACKFVSSTEIHNIPSNWITKPIICSGENIKIIYQYHDFVIILEYPNKYKTYPGYKFISNDDDRILMLDKKNQYIRDGTIIKSHIDSKLLYVFDSSENIKYYVYEFGVYANDEKIYPDACCPPLDVNHCILFARQDRNLFVTIGIYVHDIDRWYTSTIFRKNKHHAFCTSRNIDTKSYMWLGDNRFELTEHNNLKIQYSHHFAKEIQNSIICDSFTIRSNTLYTVRDNVVSKHNLQFAPDPAYQNNNTYHNITQIIATLVLIGIIVLLFYVRFWT